MKERPILFSAPMVRAILKGEKTMTRRVIKKQCEHIGIGRDESGVFVHRHCEHNTGITRCPYGQIGDLLWVRESFWHCIDNNDRCRYVADGEPPITPNRHYRKRPSIFLRRGNSRITLEIANVRVERLQDISEEDAKNEGASAISFMELNQLPPSLIDKTRALYRHSYRYGFYSVWENINGHGSWEVNPWVWVVEFKRIA